MVFVTALGITSCAPDGLEATNTGQFATAEIEEVIKKSVADNGLVSMRPISQDRSIDLMATSVLHRAGVADLPQPSIAALDKMCATYGESVPQHQVSGELDNVLTPERLVQAADELRCVTLDAPMFDASQNQGAQQFLLAAATWSELPGIRPGALATANVRAAVAELSDDEAGSPWSHWTCLKISKTINDPDACHGLAPIRTVDKVTSTDELMELRAAVELAQRPGSQPPAQDLVDRALELPVHDALDAQQIQRISEIVGAPSKSLESWLQSQAARVGEDGLVEGTVRVIGTLHDTYTASRILEDRTAEILVNETEQSMNEVAALAAQTSALDALVAQLMRASILDAAGRLTEDSRRSVVEDYARLVSTGCPTNQVLGCTTAVDAAYRLDEQPGKLEIPVPNALPGGAAGDELIYRVLSINWGVSNLDQWVAAALDRGLEPLNDVADSSRPTSLRLWAAAARNVLHPELGTEAENKVQEGLESLVDCQGVDGLVEDGATSTCSLDSTFAYYLSGTWGTP